MANTKAEPVFTASGTVVRGKGLGNTVGMPTANLDTSDDVSSVVPGVYAVDVTLDGRVYYGITHTGKRPSVDDSEQITIETYIFDFDGELYDKALSLRAYKFIRPTVNFDSLEEVKKQVDKDIAAVKEFFKTIGGQ